MSELKPLPCPFCGKAPEIIERPDSLDGHFCAIACFCGGYTARAHQFATDKESADVAREKATDAWNRRTKPDITGETSDGYHTFNELYHHRAVLFSVICNARPDMAWKSEKHYDGTMYDGMFIVGINTPDGQATYHYDVEPYWDMFRVQDMTQAPEWDGHTPAQAIERIGRLRTKPYQFPGPTKLMPDNEPLTLEELRGMEGEPVWVTHKDGSGGRWGIVNSYKGAGMCADLDAYTAHWFDDWCGTIAYRRKKEDASCQEDT